MSKSETYAIVLSKNQRIVQIRNFVTNYETALSHAKEFSISGSSWFDKVALYKTVDHVGDLLNEGEELSDLCEEEPDTDNYDR
jgi:hypothetical protein